MGMEEWRGRGEGGNEDTKWGVGAGSPEQKPQMEMGPVQGSLPSHSVVTQLCWPEQTQSKALEDKGRNHTRGIS